MIHLDVIIGTGGAGVPAPILHIEVCEVEGDGLPWRLLDDVDTLQVVGVGEGAVGGAKHALAVKELSSTS